MNAYRRPWETITKWKFIKKIAFELEFGRAPYRASWWQPIELLQSKANFGHVWATETYDTFLESSSKISKNEHHYKSVTHM